MIYSMTRASASILCLVILKESTGFVKPPVIPCSITHDGTYTNRGISLRMAGNEDFWAKQKVLMEEMSRSTEKSLKAEQMDKFVKRQNNLLGDTVYISVLIFAALWCVANSVFTPISFAFGTTCGLAYTYGLSKYVETIGGSADDEGAVEGSGIGQARFAFLILLLVFIGKFRSSGLQEIPAILGFFTYQLASLSQGLREFND